MTVGKLLRGVDSSNTIAVEDCRDAVEHAATKSDGTEPPAAQTASATGCSSYGTGQ